MDGFSVAASVIAATQPNARTPCAPIILVPLEDRRIPALKPIVSHAVAPKLYSNTAFYLCSSLQELHDGIRYLSILFRFYVPFIGGDVASAGVAASMHTQL